MGGDGNVAPFFSVCSHLPDVYNATAARGPPYPMWANPAPAIVAG
jgi:hypothetical protein